MPLALVGPELKVGQPAPDFEVIDKGMAAVTLASTAGRVRVFSVVPSLDTPVCDMQTKRFNDAAVALPQIDFYTVSVDLPFAQGRWCNQFAVDNVKMLSDHRLVSFATAYGTLIRDWRIESRAIFVVDAAGTLRYVEYVPEVAEHPNYEAVLATAKALL
jgi:thiol peroxidase